MLLAGIGRHKESSKGTKGLSSRCRDGQQFRRGWVVQEVGTGTPATMILGDATIDWEKITSVCERLKGNHQLLDTLGATTSNIAFLYRQFTEPEDKIHHANRYNFIYELQRSWHLQLTNDKELVFAFLGHFSVDTRHQLGCGPMLVTADYTKTVEQTYINIAVQTFGEI